MTAKNDILIEQRKVQLISMIAKLYDMDIVEQIENILLSSKKDWWHTINEEERKAIDKGLEDVKNGHLYTHKEVMQDLNQRYNNL